MVVQMGASAAPAMEVEEKKLLASGAEDADPGLGNKDLSKKGIAHPAQPDNGTVGKKNHYLVAVADNLYHHNVAIKLIILLILLCGIGAYGSCDTTGLSPTIGLYCTTRTATVMCCDALVAAVDVGGISCLCQTASDPEVRNSLLNKTDLLRLYRECGGRHVPLEIYCDLAPAPAPALPPTPAHSPAPPPSTPPPPPPPPSQPPPPPAGQVPPPPTSDEGGEEFFLWLHKFLSTWWGKVLFIFGGLAGVVVLSVSVFCVVKHGHAMALAAILWAWLKNCFCFCCLGLAARGHDTPVDTTRRPTTTTPAPTARIMQPRLSTGMPPPDDDDLLYRAVSG